MKFFSGKNAFLRELFPEAAKIPVFIFRLKICICNLKMQNLPGCARFWGRVLGIFPSCERLCWPVLALWLLAVPAWGGQDEAFRAALDFWQSKAGGMKRGVTPLRLWMVSSDAYVFVPEEGHGFVWVGETGGRCAVLGYSLTADVGPSNVSNSKIIINSYTPWRPSAGVSESGLQPCGTSMRRSTACVLITVTTMARGARRVAWWAAWPRRLPR